MATAQALAYCQKPSRKPIGRDSGRWRSCGHRRRDSAFVWQPGDKLVALDAATDQQPRRGGYADRPAGTPVMCEAADESDD